MSSVVCFHSMCVHEIGICMHMCISVVVCMYVLYTRYGHVRDKFIDIKKTSIKRLLWSCQGGKGGHSCCSCQSNSSSP